MVEKYEGKFVAIENESVLDSDKDLNRLIERLEKAGRNPANLVIKHIKKMY